MSVPLKDRPLESVREEVIDQLILNYSHGELSADAFERRLDKAYDLNEQEQIAALSADLPLKSDARYHSEKAARLGPKFTSSVDGAEAISITSILSSNHRSGEWIVPKEIQLKNYLGSLELDFTNAIFSHPEVHIYIDCILGSDEIFVPDTVDVITDIRNVMGSVENTRNTLASAGQVKQRPRIYVHGRMILGSIEISVKRSMKAQIKQFADGLKSLFGDGTKSKS
ncbi:MULTISPECIES: LiaF domain-containing protein [unclassified Pseudoalteromonas]|uniref:LiaF domain-containing protein n=1 Tax=unclassified Pseudoalteromonas TaxID=194690 RepID=UPI001F1963FB|nr:MULTISPECIES: LiaF domain-containing protein [unclassified Pseudoalteromonas]MCF2826018.1 cell wall-active antibiotics response protein [Pseudoalteromonas sp. OF5H-5]MCF2831673.1 cell wall-active antibiotics response protein [Pseudoalteromonas sp. DL2-H6]MCF2925033.1 cell wall-active antibiotics response protein [Pseudoalteromonas sp. DL2-H1]